MLGPRHHDFPQPSSHTVEQNGCAGADGIGGFQQVLRRDALEHDGCGIIERQRIRNFHQPLCRIKPGRSIGTQRAGGIGHAIPCSHVADTRPHRGDTPSALQPKPGWQRNGHRSPTLGNVEKVHTYSLLLEPDLALAWRLFAQCLQVQHFRGAEPVKPDRRYHGHFSFRQKPLSNKWPQCDN
ncbi:hypothetical protein D3C78_1131420 [compost metagenome]